MNILVVSATELEITPFIKLNTGADILICGVGIPATAYLLTKKLLAKKYDVVIQAGIAGSFTKKIKNGEVVMVVQDAFGDIGVEEKKEFKTIFQLGFDDENKHPYTNGWLINSSGILQKTNLKKVKAITVNKIVDSKKKIKELKNFFNADIESMEGAAFHLVCINENIAFVQLRSISNRAGERDKAKWAIITAIENLNIELKKLIDTITI